MRLPTAVVVLIAMFVSFPAIGAAAQSRTGLLPAPKDLVAGIPKDFPRFHFKNHDEQAQLLSRYLWYFLDKRVYFGMGTFYQEYMTQADLWVAGFKPRKPKMPIQKIYRGHLLNTKLDAEGYVHTHQHYSHAHEHGWPFPMWTQVFGGVNGNTFGFHFQEDGPNWVWVWHYLKGWNDKRYHGTTCLNGWELRNVKSFGIVNKKWHLKATGESPAITLPAEIRIDAFQAPFLQLRWKRTGKPRGNVRPYVEWMRDGDKDFAEDRRVHFDYEANEDHQPITGTNHCMIRMYDHPKWKGKITRVRLSLAPGESDVAFDIDSFFTCYDTRHPINNPIFILASRNYFRWTGDHDFLQKNIDRMRRALRYQQTVMGGLKHNHIRNPWPGHDGLAGYVRNKDGSKTFRHGHGIGNNYYDLVPFGGDDMYSTSQYYAATVAMADIEEMIQTHPKWSIPRGKLAFDPTKLRAHAAKVKEVANEKFWNKAKGRFIGSIDVEGTPHDYGFVFVNLDAIWYGIASDEHARQIMNWLTGKRIIEGDTSTGKDIYHWRFAPRATTKRNIEWYGQGWHGPEAIPFGDQIQDGGAVLGFTFYDLWARLHVLGPDDAWGRLMEILAWEKEVRAAGGYRAYYKDGKRGKLQGGGTPGGLGIDVEFLESSLLPSIVTYGFVGLNPTGAELVIDPKLPKRCPQMAISNVLYRGVRLDIRVSNDVTAIEVKTPPAEALRIRFKERRTLGGTDKAGLVFAIDKPGLFRFRK